jgi:hypothetical protein
MPSNWFFIIPVLFSSSIAVFSANRQCLDLATVHLQPTRLGLTEIVYKSDVLTLIVQLQDLRFSPRLYSFPCTTLVPRWKTLLLLDYFATWKVYFILWSSSFTSLIKRNMPSF